MREFFNIYRRHSNPLEKLEFATKGEFIYTSYGDCFKCIDKDEKETIFQEFHESVLNSGEEVENMSYDVLKLFWTLSDKSFNNAVKGLQNKNQDEGNEAENSSEYGK